MKLRPAVAIIALIALFSLFVPAPKALADSTAPPALAIAQRLLTESHAARDYARLLAASNKPGPELDAKGFDSQGNPPTDPATASYQHQKARIRALQAVAQYMMVPSSATYGRTPFAPEACYEAAVVQLNDLHDPTGAMTSLQLIDNKYSGVSFPNQAAAAALQKQLATTINTINQTTSPGSILYGAVDFLVHLTGAKPWSYALAILMIGVLVRLAVTPLSNMTYKSMKEQQKLQPMIKEIQAKYKDDRELVGKKTMELYAEHGINPAAGCIPLLIQMPVFFLLIYTIRLYQYQFVHGTFLWIGSPLSHMFPAYLATNLGQVDYPLMLLYGGSMFLQQKMMPPPADPAQAEQQRSMALMSPIITIFFTIQYHWPCAFVLYYLIFNLLSMAQQKYYMKKRAGDDEKKTDLSTPAILLNGNGTAAATLKSAAAEKLYGKPETKSSTPSNGSTPKSSSGNASTSPRPQAKKRKR
jgi:YidC/Oxa1 family membrane protein insertase